MLAYLRQTHVFRPEIVPPEAEAVRFVHHQQRDLQLWQKPLKGERRKSLGRQIEQSCKSATKFSKNLRLLSRRLRAIQQQGGNAQALQLLNLISHQRNQRRDNECQVLLHQRRQLKAEALACAGRHHAQHVAAAHDIFDNLSLMRTELRKPEDPLQKIVDAIHASRYFFHSNPAETRDRLHRARYF